MERFGRMHVLGRTVFWERMRGCCNYYMITVFNIMIKRCKKFPPPYQYDWHVCPRPHCRRRRSSGSHFLPWSSSSLLASDIWINIYVYVYIHIYIYTYLGKIKHGGFSLPSPHFSTEKKTAKQLITVFHRNRIYCNSSRCFSERQIHFTFWNH